MQIKIDKSYENRTLLSFIKSELRLSHRLLSRLKRTENGILINGKHVTVRYILKAGDILELADEDTSPSETVEPVELSVDIIFEDDDIIAVNKPASMPTHPSHEHQEDTLANALAFYFKSKGIPFVFRAVNRLDRDTSGVVLVAKNKNAAFVLSKQIAEFKVEKKYIAIAEGELSCSGRIEGAIRRVNDGKMKRGVFDDGQCALTEYEVIGIKDGLSTVLVTPKTGRTHQIRVHFSHIGHPLAGDTLYGNEKGSDKISRQALHAYSLSFSLPSRNKIITVTAPIPSDMAQIGVYG
jgi:23S rRNA pseudouridine1911/1915/1917 synthase